MAAQYTKNLHLIKPGYEDLADIMQINENMDKLDAASVKATTATDNANQAADRANEAAQGVDTAKQQATDAAVKANAAAEKANTAASGADSAAVKANASASKADASASAANVAAQNADTATSKANAAATGATNAASSANTAASEATKAAENANAKADYIGKATFTAHNVEPGGTATVTKTDKDGHAHFDFGLVKGIPGEGSVSSVWRTQPDDAGDAKPEVGGRNYYKATQDFGTSGNWDSSRYNKWKLTAEKYKKLSVMQSTGRYNGITQYIVCQKGEKYTFSCYAKRIGTEAVDAHIEVYTFDDASVSKLTPTLLGNIGTDWARYYLTFECTNNGSVGAFIENWSANANDSTCSIAVCGMKLERGVLPTDWSPAPEDKQDKIDYLGGRNLLKNRLDGFRFNKPAASAEASMQILYSERPGGIIRIIEPGTPRDNSFVGVYLTLLLNSVATKNFSENIADMPIGTKYVVTAIMRVTSGSASLNFMFFDGDLFSYRSNIPKLTSQWTKVETFLEKTKDGPQTLLVIYFNINQPGTVIEIADVKVERGSVPTDWSPAPEDTVSPSHNYLYDGVNLKEVFGAAESFHSAMDAGDFSKIRVGDYFPITLNGTVHDYGDNTDKTLTNAVMIMEVAAINPYWKYINDGENDPMIAGKNHLLLCSRDCLPFTTKFCSEPNVWTNSAATCQWLGSALYETLNNAVNGVLPCVLATELGPYVYAGPYGTGMRWVSEIKGLGIQNATGIEWRNRGRLFLPSEREVWGADVWSEHSYGGLGTALQWPIFSGSRRHIMKGLGNSGSRCNWWTESSAQGSDLSIVYTSNDGASYFEQVHSLGSSAPICFLFV